MPDLRDLNAEELQRFLDEHGSALLEDEALLILENRFCTPAIAQRIAQDQRLTAYYSVRAALVRNRATPQAHALKFVHYLYWRELLKFSTDTRISAAVRRAIDQQMLMRLPKITLGEKIAAARACSRELIRALLTDPNPRVFEALLVNPRLTEPDLVTHISSNRASGPQLAAIAASPKWSYRRAIRRALVINTDTPKAIVASQVRHLTRREMEEIAKHPQASAYVKMCIRRLG